MTSRKTAAKETTPDAKKFKTEPCAQVSYSVEKDYFDDSKSILAKIKGEDIDITSDSENDEDELEILSTFALGFVKEEK